MPSNFMSDVRAGFQGAMTTMGQTGLISPVTPNNNNVVNTPYGTYGIPTPPVMNLSTGYNPIVGGVQTPMPMMGAPVAQFNPFMAEAMSGMDQRSIPAPNYFTPSQFATDRDIRSRAYAGVTPVHTGIMGHLARASGVFPRPLGYDPYTGGRSATSVVNKAYTYGLGASTFAAGFAGNLAGDYIGGAAGALLGGAVGGPLGAFMGGMAGSVIGSDIIGTPLAVAMNPFSQLLDRRSAMLGVNSATRGVITTGSNLNYMGSGFNRVASSDIASQMFKMAASDNIFSQKDFQNILQNASSNGFLNMSQSPDQVVKVVKDLSKSLKVFMSVAGDPDVTSAMSKMGDLYRMGFALPKLNQAQSNIRAFARMAGLTDEQALQQYGMPGGFMYQSMGLTQGAGVMAGVASGGFARSIVQNGVFDAGALNRMGGESGIAQSLMQANAGLFGQGIDPFMVGLVKRGPGGALSVDMSKAANFISGKSSMQDLLSNGAVNDTQSLQYLLNNLSGLKSQLSEGLGATGQQALMLRLVQSIKQQAPGLTTQSAARMLTGDDNAAKALTAIYENPSVMRDVMRQQSIEGRRTSNIAIDQFNEQNSYWERTLARPTREYAQWFSNTVFGLSKIDRGVSSLEDTLQASASGLDVYRNPYYAGGFDMSVGTSSLSGRTRFRDERSLGHLRGSASRAMSNLRGGTSMGNALRAFIGYDQEYISKTYESLSAIRQAVDSAQGDKLPAVLDKLKRTYGDDVVNNALSEFRKTAANRGSLGTTMGVGGSFSDLGNQAVELGWVQSTQKMSQADITTLIGAGYSMYGDDRDVLASMQRGMNVLSQLESGKTTEIPSITNSSTFASRVVGMYLHGVNPFGDVNKGESRLGGRGTSEKLRRVNKLLLDSGITGSEWPAAMETLTKALDGDPAARGSLTRDPKLSAVWKTIIDSPSLMEDLKGVSKNKGKISGGWAGAQGTLAQLAKADIASQLGNKDAEAAFLKATDTRGYISALRMVPEFSSLSDQQLTDRISFMASNSPDITVSGPGGPGPGIPVGSNSSAESAALIQDAAKTFFDSAGIFSKAVREMPTN